MGKLLSQEEIDKHLADLSVEWAQAGDALEREFDFKDFKSALDFVNRIGKLAEKQNHHPDIALTWGRVVIQITSHNEGGITEKDFELAEKIDELG